MFSLEKTQVKLASVNPRAEIHGDSRVPAFDLKIEAVLPNHALIEFHSELRQMLYKKNETPDLVDAIEPDDALTELRFPKMGAIKWEWEGSGYTVTVAYGIGGPSDIVLGECKLDGFKFIPQNGGSLGLGFRVICHPESADVGKLCEFIQQNIDITVTPPEAKNLGELFGEAA